jgi:hypothetical protein
MKLALAAFAALLLLSPDPARADTRRFEIAAQLPSNGVRELDATDFGFGARAGYRPLRMLGLEAELNLFPSDIPDEPALTSSRVEGLFGVVLGPQFERLSVFGKLRPGFVRFAEAPAPVPCIAIFPPPLTCVLAGGRTVAALDVGGGVEYRPSQRALVRVDVSNLLLRYPGPTLKRGFQVAEDDFWSGNLRLAAGVGLRF